MYSNLDLECKIKPSDDGQIVKSDSESQKVYFLAMGRALTQLMNQKSPLGESKFADIICVGTNI